MLNTLVLRHHSPYSHYDDGLLLVCGFFALGHIHSFMKGSSAEGQQFCLDQIHCFSPVRHLCKSSTEVQCFCALVKHSVALRCSISDNAETPNVCAVVSDQHKLSEGSSSTQQSFPRSSIHEAPLLHSLALNRQNSAASCSFTQPQSSSVLGCRTLGCVDFDFHYGLEKSLPASGSPLQATKLTAIKSHVTVPSLTRPLKVCILWCLKSPSSCLQLQVSLKYSKSHRSNFRFPAHWFQLTSQFSQALVKCAHLMALSLSPNCANGLQANRPL